MNKPWEIKISDKRKADSIPTFIIFCEDKVSEPVYLKYFETSKIKINFAKEQKNLMANVLSAITHCKENGLIEYIDGKACLTAEETQIWCVYDRDKEETPAKLSKGNTSFDESIKTANSNGIKVAWSNDAFELWILLHFEEIDVTDDGSKNRKTYYDRLTEIFRNLENPNEALLKVLSYNNYNYKNSLKSERNFRNIVRNEIVGKTNEAISRAKLLENYFEKGDIQNHEKSPCTLMHHLVEELISSGEKSEETRTPLNFIESKIEEDIRNNKNQGKVYTRFPPEPNGYLHIGHAKSICLNFGLGAKYNGKTNLRFDDTNPIKEEIEYINSILEDIEWLGFNWEGEPRYASDYFDRLYEWAIEIINKGKAYVDDQSAAEIASQKGTPTEPGQESPNRDRSIQENRDLFGRMKNGEFEEGSKVLRAKIDMASPNMHLRDPLMYRILKKPHHRTGDKWCIYPMYDWAHGQSDFIEGITHSLCTLEFEVHRPLYDWFLDQIIENDYRPVQTEFARLNLSYTIMSKRKLLELVNEGDVTGWNDPRMPTISGLRRRGYTPESIRNFADRIGVAKRDNVIDVALLEHALKDDLNKKAPRVMAVLDPLKVIITNYPEEKTEDLETINNPEDESMGSRTIPFSREILIEKSDFMEDPPRKFFRLGPGREVRLKSAYIIKCEDFKKDPETGEITELYCTYDQDTKSGSGSQRKVKGTLHWVSASHAINAEVRMYDRLFDHPDPAGQKDDDYKKFLNQDSLKVLKCKVEPSLSKSKPMDKFQFQRIGYFCVDYDSTEDHLVFNSTVPLRDSWEKMKKMQEEQRTKK